MAEPFGQECPEPGLDLVGRREIRVAAFRRAGDVFLSAPDQKRLAETGARGQHGDRGLVLRLAAIDLDRFVRQ